MSGPMMEQFAMGTLIYYMLYGDEPYAYEDLRKQNPQELERWFSELEFLQLDRCEVLDTTILGCWHGVYPTLSVLALMCKAHLAPLASSAFTTTTTSSESVVVRINAERKTCEALIRRGLLGSGHFASISAFLVSCYSLCLHNRLFDLVPLVRAIRGSLSASFVLA